MYRDSVGIRLGCCPNNGEAEHGRPRDLKWTLELHVDIWGDLEAAKKMLSVMYLRSLEPDVMSLSGFRAMLWTQGSHSACDAC